MTSRSGRSERGLYVPPPTRKFQGDPLMVVADKLNEAVSDARRIAGEQGVVWHPFTVRLAQIECELRDVIANAEVEEAS